MIIYGSFGYQVKRNYSVNLSVSNSFPSTFTIIEPFKMSTENTNIMRVAVKLPPFWREQSELWFKSAEAQFVISGITSDETKYYTVVAAVESDVLAQVSDIIMNPPTTLKYDSIKERIIERFADSEQKKLKRLLSEIELGDRSPSQLLMEMRKYAGDKVSDEFLTTMWLNCLPQNARAILATLKDGLDSLAKVAEKIIEVGGIREISVDTVSKPFKSGTYARIDILEKKMDENTELLKKLLSRNRSRSRSRAKPGASGECWYHEKFAQNATKCIKPCTYVSKN